MKKKTATIYDPYHTKPSPDVLRVVCQLVKVFMKMLNLGSNGWQSHATTLGPPQKDGVNCGVFTGCFLLSQAFHTFDFEGSMELSFKELRLNLAYLSFLIVCGRRPHLFKSFIAYVKGEGPPVTSPPNSPRRGSNSSGCVELDRENRKRKPRNAFRVVGDAESNTKKTKTSMSDSDNSSSEFDVGAAVADEEGNAGSGSDRSGSRRREKC
jgi:hypothetical protein